MTIIVMDVDDIFHIQREKADNLEDAFAKALEMIEDGTEEVEIKFNNLPETIKIDARYCDWV